MAFRCTRRLLQGHWVRISERKIQPGMEERVKEAMSNVRRDITSVPGFVAIDTVQSLEDEETYCILSTWDSKQALTRWLKSPLYKEHSETLNRLLHDRHNKPKTRTYREAHEDVFLL
eukprot:g2038.t1